MDIEELTTKYFAFEKTLDLFDRKISDVFFWDILRLPLYNEIASKVGVNKIKKPAKAKKFSLSYYFSLITRSPFLVKRRQYLFFGPGADRRVIREDGIAVDIYCDSLIGYLGQDKCNLIEGVGNKSELALNRPTRNVRYSNVFNMLEIIFSKMLGSVNISNKDFEFLEEIESNVKSVFGVQVDVKARLMSLLKVHTIRVKIFLFYLRFAKPEVIFLVCSYGKEDFICAAQKIGIPTVEIQHGNISSFHLAYHYPLSKKKHLFPKYFLSMGRYWHEAVRLPINESNIFTLGYPHLTEKHLSKKKMKTFAFLSQWTIGRELSLFAMRFSKLCPRDYRIVYKLHPGENQNWQVEYPWLKQQNIEVVTSDGSDLHNILSTAEFQVGVYSTAIYEGLYLGCKTVLVNLPGIENMNDLLRVKSVRLVSEPSEITLESIKSELVDPEYFFANEWKPNLRTFMRSIL